MNGKTRPGVLGTAPRHAGPARTGRGAGTLSPRRGRQDLGPGCLNGGLRLISLSPEKPSAPVQSLHRVLQPGLPQRSQRGPLCAQLLRQPPPVPASQRLSGVWTLPLGESSGWEMPGGASRAWGARGGGRLGGGASYAGRSKGVGKGRGGPAWQVHGGRRSGGLSSPTSVMQIEVTVTVEKVAVIMLH